MHPAISSNLHDLDCGREAEYSGVPTEVQGEHENEQTVFTDALPWHPNSNMIYKNTCKRVSQIRAEIQTKMSQQYNFPGDGKFSLQEASPKTLCFSFLQRVV